MTEIPTIPTKDFDVKKIRREFPVLHRKVYGKPLIYFDNAASSQKPRQVIDALNHYYSFEHSNIHRGVHHLSAEATTRYEEVREKTRQFIHAGKTEEIIFTKGATDAINLVANSFSKKFIGEGDEVIISGMEHHSNIVPWQMICDERKAKLRIIPISDEGELIWEEYEKLLNERTKLVSICHVSNTLGTINPVEKIIEAAHKKNIPVMLDGAQAAPHTKVDVQGLNVDFYAFSSHKMYGPTGIGILYGKEKWLKEMPPYQGGGDMIKNVSFEKTTYNDLPFKFEAGTPNIADAIAFGACIDYMNSLDHEQVSAYENHLLQYAEKELNKIPEIRIIGTAKNKVALISFLIGAIHPYDAGTILDRLGIAIRTGHHCTEPLMKRFDIPGTIRASFAFYNTTEEIDTFIKGVQKVKEMLG